MEAPPNYESMFSVIVSVKLDRFFYETNKVVNINTPPIDIKTLDEYIIHYLINEYGSRYKSHEILSSTTNVLKRYIIHVSCSGMYKDEYSKEWFSNYVIKNVYNEDEAKNKLMVEINKDGLNIDKIHEINILSCLPM